MICADGGVTRFDAADRAWRRCSSCRTRRSAPPRRARALPAEVPLADAVFNVAHGALLTLGLARGDWDLVGRGLDDRLHQPYRAHLYPRSAELVRDARELGALGATISGAGPTVLVWTHYEQTGGGRRSALRERADGWARRPARRRSSRRARTSSR